MAESLMAVFGDIHSNLEAFQAVLADMDSVGVNRCVCLGDIVGYGANPAQCLELVRSLGCPVVKGNHDAFAAADEDVEGINEAAQRGIEFSRKKLSLEQREYLDDLPFDFTDVGCEFVHASLNSPEDWWYLRSERDVRFHFNSQVHPIAFCGHTHVPRVWYCNDDGAITDWRGRERIELPENGKVLVNVGSVGQPRDLCPDACYVVFRPASREVEFRRVVYDIPKTRRKILRAKLPRYSAQRLSLGR